MKRIGCGDKPTDVFKAMIADDPSISNTDLASEFKKEFVLVKAEALQSIWQWRRPGRNQGIDDGRLDSIVTHYLKEAGYLRPDKAE